MITSILQHLLALYFAIICNWELSSSEKSLVGYSREKKFILFFFHFFPHFLWQMPDYLVSNAKRLVDSKTPKHNGFEQFWKFEFRFEHFPRNTRFLSIEGPSNYLYIRITDWHWGSSGPEECPLSHLKVTKMWFGPNISEHVHSEPFFADFYCREGISCLR